MPVTVAVVVNVSTIMEPSAVSMTFDSSVPPGEEQAVTMNSAGKTHVRAAHFSSFVFIDSLNLRCIAASRGKPGATSHSESETCPNRKTGRDHTFRSRATGGTARSHNM